MMATMQLIPGRLLPNWLISSLLLYHVVAFVPHKAPRGLAQAPFRSHWRQRHPLYVSVSSPLDTATVPDMSLLQSAQASSSFCLEEMTNILLDSQKHPVGSLSYDVLDAAFPVLYAWAKTHCPMGAQTAERVLTRLEGELDMGNTKVQLTNKHYAVAIDAWAKSGQVNAAQKAEGILTRLENQPRSNGRGSPNRVVYNSVLNAFAQEGKVKDALRLLERVPQDQVTVKEYSVVLAAHARAGQARPAEALLQRMVSDETMPRPNLISYNCVLDANAKSGKKGAAERAESILNALLENSKSDPSMAPDGRSFACVAQAVIKSGASDKVKRVQAILDQARSHGITMDAYLQNMLLEAWSVDGDAKKAQSRLEQMEQDGVANVVSYNTVLKAWKNSRTKDAARQAEAILERMEELGLADVFTYSSVIDCYAKQRQRGSAGKAEQLLARMIEKGQQGHSNVRPNTVTVNSVLDALAKSGEKGAAARADKLLASIENSQEPSLEGVRLNAISYTSVIDAYAKSGEQNAASHAEAIFQRMEEAYAQGNDAAKPNGRTFSTRVNAWAQSGKPGSAERAESLLLEMEDAYRNGETDIVPSCVTYSIVMNGWAKSGARDAAEKAVEVFNRMCDMYKAGNEKARPSFFSYVTLVDAIVKNGGIGAAQRAEDILLEMLERYEAGNQDLKPNARLITTVIDCWGKCGVRNGGEKAEALLNWMIDTYESSGDIDFLPNEITFSASVNAWAKSRRFGKAYRARSVLQKMIDLREAGKIESGPSVVVYTSVINACAYTVGDPGEKADAMQIAANTFNELCSSDYAAPNHVTYGSYITACRNLLPQGETRTRALVQLFHKCCQDGQVNDIVIRILKGALTAEQLEDAGLGGDASAGSLPDEWRCNVDERRPRRKMATHPRH